MSQYRDKVYAGILGKVVGVYFGRPVEGWPYGKIRDRFGIVDHYVADEVGVPLHVADDDLAGTFTFFNAVEDHRGDIRSLTAEDFGNAWLDYVIENKTVFWWGGIGRSTEHTAFLRLKEGIKAPESGSAALNGIGVAEQIGALIFIEALAFLCPSDPELARYLVRQSASVSHDKMALEAACFFASMESMAFSERNLDRLLDEGLRLCGYAPLIQLVECVREETLRIGEFRQVRGWLEENYGYARYPGNCHVAPNLALMIACLLLGGDSFSMAMRYCISSGWDTDCNGGNIGALNAVRLGLGSMKNEFDYLTPVADLFYSIAGNAGAGVTDAVQQTNRIVVQYNRLYHEKEPVDGARYSFSLPGSVQGFVPCPVLGEDGMRRDRGSVPCPVSREGTAMSNDRSFVSCSVPGGNTGMPYNRNLEVPGENGLVISVKGHRAAVSTPCMWEPSDRQDNYQLIASPTLYETQTVTFTAEPLVGTPAVAPYIVYFDFDDRERVVKGPSAALKRRQELQWKIPAIGGFTIGRFGFCVEGKDGDRALIRSLDWAGAPEALRIRGSLRNYDLGCANMQLQSFVASAKQFSFDARRTFVVSDTERGGVAVTGTDGWKDYCVECLVNPSLNERFGLIGRVRGLRRYYGVLLDRAGRLRLIAREGAEETVLAGRQVAFGTDMDYPMSLSMCGKRIRAEFDGQVLEAEDGRYVCGGCGFAVDAGTFLVSDFCVRARSAEQSGNQLLKGNS